MSIKYVAGSSHFVRSDLHGLEPSGVVCWLMNSVGRSKVERFCCGHVGNI